MLELDNLSAVIDYDGSAISAKLEAGFPSPLSHSGGKGTASIGFSSVAGLKGEIAFDADIPGFKKANVHGSISYPPFGATIGAHLEPENKYIKSADVSVGFEGGAFSAKASITLTLGGGLELTVGASYSKAKGFEIMGVSQGGAPAEDTEHSIAKKEFPFPTIPLLTVGVATLGLHFGMGVEAGYRMPKFRFDTPKIEGGLDALGGGGLPPISFGGGISMTAFVQFYFNVQIVGEIQLLIATARAGIGAELDARLDLTLGADMHGTFRPGHGAHIDIDPSVGATLSLIASLIATLYAKIAFWTVLDKKYTLASMTLAKIDLGTFHPFEPIGIDIGGDQGTRFTNGLHLREDANDHIVDGVKEGGKKAANSESNKEAAEKIRPVLMALKGVAPQFKELPGGWESGLNAVPIDIRGMLPVNDKQFQAFKEHFDDCEEVCGVTLAAPEEKVVKIAVIQSPQVAGRILLAYWQALIAAKGIDPSNGVNVVAEREDVQAMQTAKWQAEYDAVVAQNKAEHDAWVAQVAKAATDFASAQKEHTQKILQQKQEHQLKVKKNEEEGKLAAKKVQEADKEGEKEVSKEKASEQDKAPPPPPPPEPPPPPPLAKPAPIPAPPPHPLPPEPTPIPKVTLPAVPSEIGAAPPGASTAPSKPAERVRQRAVRWW